ncbi:hypothetical protein [Streptomyces sp. NPDC101150]|uniref:hypothetical protein n=1 Tax=Streptomyces sp. NPDC101150 TaxID=3366114 RepID=UPI0037FC2E73
MSDNAVAVLEINCGMQDSTWLLAEIELAEGILPTTLRHVLTHGAEGSTGGGSEVPHQGPGDRGGPQGGKDPQGAELETELHRKRLARKYNLPDALAARIFGADDDARDTDAEEMAELFHSRGDGVGRGGLDPSTEPGANDPAELATAVPRGRR